MGEGQHLFSLQFFRVRRGSGLATQSRTPWYADRMTSASAMSSADWTGQGESAAAIGFNCNVGFT